MGTYKQYLIEQEELEDQGPEPIDFETKRSYNAKPKKTIVKPKKKKIKKTPVKTNSEPVPMSVNLPFDNAYEWLDDEPWRKW